MFIALASTKTIAFIAVAFFFFFYFLFVVVVVVVFVAVVVCLLLFFCVFVFFIEGRQSVIMALLTTRNVRSVVVRTRLTGKPTCRLSKNLNSLSIKFHIKLRFFENVNTFVLTPALKYRP